MSKENSPYSLEIFKAWDLPRFYEYLNKENIISNDENYKYDDELRVLALASNGDIKITNEQRFVAHTKMSEILTRLNRTDEAEVASKKAAESFKNIGFEIIEDSQELPSKQANIQGSEGIAIPVRKNSRNTLTPSPEEQGNSWSDSFSNSYNSFSEMLSGISKTFGR